MTGMIYYHLVIEYINEYIILVIVIVIVVVMVKVIIKENVIILGKFHHNLTVLPHHR